MKTSNPWRLLPILALLVSACANPHRGSSPNALNGKTAPSPTSTASPAPSAIAGDAPTAASPLTAPTPPISYNPQPAPIIVPQHPVSAPTPLPPPPVVQTAPVAAPPMSTPPMNPPSAPPRVSVPSVSAPPISAPVTKPPQVSAPPITPPQSLPPRNSAPPVSPVSSSPTALSVLRGTGGAPGTLVDGNGHLVQFHGVNRSGSEYACVQGIGFFDGPVDQASIDAMKSWKINAVRVPLNEDCWLAINGAPDMFAGGPYRRAITAYVDLLNKNGLYVILDLHWSGAGNHLATQQQPMSDADHSPAFWASVAQNFLDRPQVLFDLFNEPFLNNSDWDCWLKGGRCALANNVNYPVAGMATLIKAIRSTGSRHVILLSGLDYGHDFAKWVETVNSIPTLPAPLDGISLENIAASWHLYDFSSMQTGCPSQYNAYGPSQCNTGAQTAAGSFIDQVFAAGFPVVLGETGISATPRNRAFSSSQVQALQMWWAGLMTYLEQQGQGYLAWAWDIRGTPALIDDYRGLPSAYEGVIYINQLSKF